MGSYLIKKPAQQLLDAIVVVDGLYFLTYIEAVVFQKIFFFFCILIFSNSSLNHEDYRSPMLLMFSLTVCCRCVTSKKDTLVMFLMLMWQWSHYVSRVSCFWTFGFPSFSWWIAIILGMWTHPMVLQTWLPYGHGMTIFITHGWEDSDHYFLSQWFDCHHIRAFVYSHSPYVLQLLLHVS